MPTYEYECECGEITEMVLSIHDDSRPDRVKCSCGKRATRILSVPFIQDGSPTWLQNFSSVQQDDDKIMDRSEKPVETRKEYREYLKSHDCVERT